MDTNTLLITVLIAWIIWGIFWLLKKKLRIFKRLGYDLTADQLRQKGKEGDKEIQKLLKDTKIFMFIGIIFFLCVAISKKYLG
ncbi:hypothetical protein [Undibacterium sp. Ren11W]|uniref:hypothetical protein n=1 Tax=Undibacterium sp. Ren11W TaxID=3413045 RepID=UPI003BF44355